MLDGELIERIAHLDDAEARVSARGSLAALEVDARSAILDSCASGALIRTKGGMRRHAAAALWAQASSLASSYSEAATAQS